MNLTWFLGLLIIVGAGMMFLGDDPVWVMRGGVLFLGGLHAASVEGLRSTVRAMEFKMNLEQGSG